MRWVVEWSLRTKSLVLGVACLVFLFGGLAFRHVTVDTLPEFSTTYVEIQTEALGLSAVEALAAGIPVIASAVGGLLDFVVDGRNGLLCKPNDPAALAASIRALADDDALRQSLARNARASVVDEYDERVVFARFASLIRRLAVRRPGRG